MKGKLVVTKLQKDKIFESSITNYSATLRIKTLFKHYS